MPAQIIKDLRGHSLSPGAAVATVEIAIIMLWNF